jgi:hypothetical protein
MTCEVGIDEVACDGGGFLCVAAGAAADGLHESTQAIGGDHDSVVCGC